MNILPFKNRKQFREWLIKNHDVEKECFLLLKRGKPINKDTFYYVDAVEEALCFGWIDSTLTKIDGICYQRFSKRQKSSNWTALNIARCQRLKSLGLMDDSGLKVMPQEKDFILDKDIKALLIKNDCLDNFLKFPLLYQKIRINNLLFYKNKSSIEYKKASNHFIEQTKKNKMYGQWNDYGRLL